jgi:hypothetical protein
MLVKAVFSYITKIQKMVGLYLHKLFVGKNISVNRLSAEKEDIAILCDGAIH